MIVKDGRHIFGEIHEVRKGLWSFFLDCAFRMLIGWAGKLQSRDIGLDFFSFYSVTLIVFQSSLSCGDRSGGCNHGNAILGI